MSHHTCTICFQNGHSHSGRHDCDCQNAHWPSLCCPGCDCGSYESCYHEPRAKAEVHPSLRSLPQEEFDKLVPATEEEIQAALDKGRKNRDAFLATQFSRQGKFR